jgi:hypothetical protein
MHVNESQDFCGLVFVYLLTNGERWAVETHKVWLNCESEEEARAVYACLCRNAYQF